MIQKVFDIGIAHQKVKKDEMAIKDMNNLFGCYWQDIDLDLKNTIVKPIDMASASKMVEDYE